MAGRCLNRDGNDNGESDRNDNKMVVITDNVNDNNDNDAKKR